MKKNKLSDKGEKIEKIKISEDDDAMTAVYSLEYKMNQIINWINKYEKFSVSCMG